VACATCVKVCPYGAPMINDLKKAEIQGATCMGCGSCAAACLACTITLQHQEDVFCCNYCAYAAADLEGARRMQYPPNVGVVHVPCTGKIEREKIPGSFERGIDGVLIAGCLEGGCHFIEGNLRAKRRTEQLRRGCEVGGHLLATSEIHLVGCLARESGMRNDGVVLLNVEFDEVLKGSERVEGMQIEPAVLQRPPPGFDQGIGIADLDLGGLLARMQNVLGRSWHTASGRH
jgi:hypothetical protein